MPRKRNGEIPLPAGWDMGRDYDGKVYYIDHNNKKTTWIDPRDRYTKPQTFADCVGNELPLGWEEVYDGQIGLYYIDHINQTNQIEDPRQQWRQVQEAMLKDYLITAQEDLEAKKEIYDVKQQRLTLAQDEYQYLNNTLVNLNNSHSHSSLSSASSTTSTKYDPDLLKADVALAKNRVMRLKRELEHIRTEMIYKQRGVDTLAHVEAKLTKQHGVYNVTEAQAIVTELKNIQKSLVSGEKEKVELMQSLARLRDDLVRLQPNTGSPDSSTLSIPQDKLSTASQTDLSGEFGPIGARLAEMARMRLQYDEARKLMHGIQQQLADLDDRVAPGQPESDKDRLLLIQEKEQLLRELRSINCKNRSELEMATVQSEIRKLEQDLNTAMELSNRAIADRLKIHEQKQMLLQQLKDVMRLTTNLETQLKSMSTSTLSFSSSSSLGSLSTTSSKGSLSSLSFTDIYGIPQCSSSSEPIDLQDLHRRVEKLFNPATSVMGSNDDMSSSSPAIQPAMAVTNVLLSSHSAPSLSPRSSLSSVSPPVSPNDFGPPPTYEQAYMSSVERQRRVALGLQHPSSVQTAAVLDQGRLEDRLAELHLAQASKEEVVPPTARVEGAFGLTSGLPKSLNLDSVLTSRPMSLYDSGSDVTSNPPLSPISETVPDELKSSCLSGSNTRSVSAAVSDESVAGDSGVFEASNKREAVITEFNGESAQVQIKMRYASADELLHIDIERGRNLKALAFPENCKVCIKAALLPASSMLMSCCTHIVTDLNKPTFGETFRFPVTLNKLFTKTLQLNVWSVSVNDEDLECLGSSQVSLADFNIEEISNKWYNVLSFQCFYSGNKKTMQEREVKAEVDPTRLITAKKDNGSHSFIPGIKEESSDESTIISSQTSTLTRNQGPEAFEGEFIEEDDDEDDDDDDEDYEQDAIEEEDNDDDDDDESSLNFAQQLDQTVIMEEDINPLETCDKETNTECVFIPEKGLKKGNDDSARATVVKRSQTFSPSAPVTKSDYICKLNRSDSDSSMPLYRRGSFQRNALERRSLRWKKHPGKHMMSGGVNRTSIDLELDLRAQQTKLFQLEDDLNRLRELKRRLEETKAKGDGELPTWLSDNEPLQRLLSSVNKEVMKQTSEDKKIEKLLKKTSREIYKLRKSRKQQPNVTSFREKMAFFTRVNLQVPPLPPENELDNAKPNTSNQKNAESKDETKLTYTVDPELGVHV